MATRNLTRQFEELRERLRPVSAATLFKPKGSSTGSSTDRAGLLDESGGSPGGAGPAPVWLELVDSINNDMHNIQLNLNKLDKLHEARLKVSFDEEDSTRDREIEIMTHSITALFRGCEKKLKRIATVGNESGSPELPYQERVTRFNCMRSLATKIQVHSKHFRQAQRNFLLKVKHQQESGNAFFFENEAMEEALSLESLDKGLTETQAQEIMRQQRDITQREKEIIEIARSVNELAQLFKELSILVIDQGTIVDRIDYNVEQAAASVEKGAEELDKAEVHQKRARSTMCILFLIAAIVACMVVFLLKNS